MQTKRFQWVGRYLPIAVLSALVFAFTRAYYLGDTTNYSYQILDLVGHPWVPGSLMFDAGHLLWRPIGLLLYALLGPLLPAGQVPMLKVAVCLMGFSILCSWITVLLFYSIALRLGASRWVALVLAGSFLCFNAFLDYGHAGQSYVPGLMCLTIAVRLLLSNAANATTPSASAAAWAGIALAASALLWLPYVLCFPAVILLAACWDLDRLAWPAPDRFRCAIRVTVWTIVASSAVFAIAFAGDRLYSIAAIVDWFGSTGHGRVISPSISRTLLGIGRSFANMEDGIQFKRFLLHDPYARVTLRDLLGTSLAKLAVVYILLLAAAVGLTRSRRGRIALAVGLTAIILNVLAANFMFESGDTERYLFMLPFACMSIALVLAGAGTPRILSGVLTVALLAVSMWNLSAMSVFAIHRKEQTLALRAGVLKQHWRQPSTVALLNYQDGLFTFDETFPFNSLNHEPLRIFDILAPASARVETWRKEFATQALAAWARSGDVWLTKRVLAPRPKPDWAWAEGLDHSIPWTDFPAFFSQFEIAQEIGSEDGFVRLAPSQANRDLLWGIGILPSHPAARFLPAVR